MSFTENIRKRFESYGWNYIRVEDGNETGDISNAIEEAKGNMGGPTMIEVKTIIGYGSPNRSGKSDAHGMPLGEDEMKLTKEYYKWTFEEDFHVSDEVYETFSKAAEKNGTQKEQEWNELFAKYEAEHGSLANS